MRTFNPSLENLMKFTPTDAIRTQPSSSYTAHNGWFEVNSVSDSPKRTKAKTTK